MASWKELSDLIHRSVQNRPEDANRLASMIETLAGDEAPLAYHLTAQTPPESEPLELDIAVLSPRRVYAFTLLADNNLSATAVGLRQLTTVNIRGAGNVTIVRFLSGGDVVLTFADVGDREQGLIEFARSVVKLAWP